jgi:bifunctional ADP-heptose synthase (sugar kinase/adenylyltransferase)
VVENPSLRLSVTAVPPEAQFVIAYGGTAVTLKRKEGFSTTQLVERMKQ